MKLEKLEIMAIPIITEENLSDTIKSVAKTGKITTEFLKKKM